MVERTLPAIIIVWTIIQIILFITASSLFIYSTYKKYWRAKYLQNIIIVCTTFYLLEIFLATLYFIFLCVHGWNADADVDDQHQNPSYTFYVFGLLYLIALFINIWIWIQRLKNIFTDTEYGYPDKFILTLKIIFCFVILIGFLSFLIWAINGFDRELVTTIMVSLFALTFVVQLVALLIAFTLKLYQLRQIHSQTFLDHSLQNVLTLQLKFTVLVSVQIISTFGALVLSMATEGYTIPLAVDVFIGFMCIYCAVENHHFAFRKACLPCIWCCNLCIINNSKSMNKQVSTVNQDDDIDVDNEGSDNEANTLNLNTDA